MVQSTVRQIIYSSRLPKECKYAVPLVHYRAARVFDAIRGSDVLGADPQQTEAMPAPQCTDYDVFVQIPSLSVFRIHAECNRGRGMCH